MKLLAVDQAAYFFHSTSGYSAEALTIDEAASPCGDSVSRAVTLKSERESFVNDLYDLADACALEDWDGYGAEAVSDETYRQAYFFAESLDDCIERPTLGAEPDGHITLEWYRSPERLLSVSISPDGEINYAALAGGKSYSGSEQFSGSVPQVILALIDEVTK